MTGEEREALLNRISVSVSYAAGDKSRLRSLHEHLDPVLDSLAESKAECERLRSRVLTAAGDDLCRLSQEEIAAYTSGAVPIPPKEEFIPSCERFWEQIAATAGVNHQCLTLAQLVAENERLRSSLISQNASLHNAGNDMEDMSGSIRRLLADNAALRQQVEGLRKDAERWNVVINEMATKDVSEKHFFGRLTEAADAILSAKTAPSVA